MIIIFARQFLMLKETDFYFYHSKSPINTIDKNTSEYQKAKVTAVKKIKSKL